MGTGNARQRLETVVGLRPDEAQFLGAVEDDDIQRLLAMFEGERDRQSIELRDAVEAGLGLLPKPLRQAVARAFVGLL